MTSVAITITVALLTAIVTALLTIHIKFSPSKEEAYNGLKMAFYKFLAVIGVLSNLYFLYSEVSSPEPLTRVSVFMIVVSIVTLAFVSLSYSLTMLIITLTRESDDIHKRHFGITEKLVDNVKSYSEIQKKHVGITDKVVQSVSNTNKN